MKKLLLSTIACASLLQAAPLGFKSHTELGYIGNSGNTNTQTFAADIKLTKDWEKHALKIIFNGQ